MSITIVEKWHLRNIHYIHQNIYWLCSRQSLRKNPKVNSCFHPTKRMLPLKILYKSILMNINSEYRSKFNVYFVCFLKKSIYKCKNNQYVLNIIQLLSLLLSILSSVTWLRYCQYDVKHVTINHRSINISKFSCWNFF